MKEKKAEGEVGHEKLIDYNFRVPAVEGMGSGLGFQLKNLVPPSNYEELMGSIDSKVDLPKIINRMLGEDCQQFKLPPGYVEFKDNLLSQIVFGGLGDSPRLFLDERSLDYKTGMGTYQFEKVDDIRTALVLAKTASRYMNFLEQDDRYAYVDYISDRPRSKYFSVGLMIPDGLASEAKKFDNEFFRNEFAVEASNIAGRFGHAFNSRFSLKFENQLLWAISIIESSADACYYSINRSSIIPNSYSDHNVDYPSQAFALHGIGAAYINRLLEGRSFEVRNTT